MRLKKVPPLKIRKTYVFSVTGQDGVDRQRGETGQEQRGQIHEEHVVSDKGSVQEPVARLQTCAVAGFFVLPVTASRMCGLIYLLQGGHVHVCVAGNEVQGRSRSHGGHGGHEGLTVVMFRTCSTCVMHLR